MGRPPQADGNISVRTVEPMPGYADLITRSCSALLSAFNECRGCGFELSKRTLLENAILTWSDIVLFAVCALGWTVLRQALSAYIFRPLGRWCALQPKDASKMPESVWKLLFYTASWSYSFYLLFFTQYTFFHDPPSAFYDWKRGMAVPTDIAVAYLIQGSFYGHAIYATLHMDAWRKDSAVMLLHHVITLALITFSYAFRYHNVGILVLFLHDVNDIQLEFTKLNVYLKNRAGVYHLLNDLVSNLGCVSFGTTWFWCRLYWFPLKVLYTTCVSSLQSVPNIPFYFFFNTLLFALTLMNIYWFLYILLFVVKVLTGQMTEVNDVREYDIEGSRKTALHKKQHERPHHNSWKERTRLKNGIVKDKRLKNGIVKDKRL
ncbi:ceramide synthase 1-like [Huso huso]|uniref:Ceramide synthase 1-like n=1 Tax=Huso huso TaxID=61971 RepID=A0ABR0Y7H8_HUSHU